MSIFIPESGEPTLRDFAAYLAIGTAVGGLFAGLTLSLSAFSLPMINDRKVDAVTGVVTSINAVLANRVTMLLWLAFIVLGVVVGVATTFVGLAVILPIVGHACSHAYRDAIDANGFPPNR